MSESRDRRVFLSSTAEDLAAYRDTVANAIEMMPGFRCEHMGRFPSTSQRALDFVRDRISRCDVFIGLVGLCYGTIPPGEDRSFTELEYDAARALGKECLVFLAPTNLQVQADILHKDTEGEGWEKQQRFRAKVGECHVCSGFTTPENLALCVMASVRVWEMKKDAGTRSHRDTALQEIDCVILCGGYSRRLWPLTADICKVLLPVAGRPSLACLLDSVTKCRRVKSVILSVNAKYASALQEFAISYARETGSPPLELVVEPGEKEEDKLGSAGAFNYVVSRKYGRALPPGLLVLGGDNLFGFEFADFVQEAFSRECSVNAIHRFRTEGDVTQYGVVDLDDNNRFLAFEEKERVPSFRNVSTACYFFREREVAALQRYLNDGGDRDSLGSFLKWLHGRNNSPLEAIVYDAPWFDIGTRETLLQANWHYLKDGMGEIHGARTKIKGPVQIEATAHVEHSQIGPNVYLGANVHIYNSEITDSVIMEGSEIRKSSISDCVVGPFNEVEGGIHQMVSGPHTRLEGV